MLVAYGSRELERLLAFGGEEGGFMAFISGYYLDGRDRRLSITPRGALFAELSGHSRALGRRESNFAPLARCRQPGLLYARAPATPKALSMDRWSGFGHCEEDLFRMILACGVGPARGQCCV